MQTWVKIVAWVAGAAGVALALLYWCCSNVWTVPVDDPLLSASIEPHARRGRCRRREPSHVGRARQPAPVR